MSAPNEISVSAANAGELNQPKPRWMPLEGNPEVLNKYIKNLGVKNDNYEFVEIIGFDEELLEFVPQPVSAVLLIFPITEDHEQHRHKEFEEAEHSPPDYSQAIYFLKQTVGNACGSIAVIHAIANNLEKFQLDLHKPLAQFLETTKLMTPEQRAEHLKHAMDMATANDNIAEEGESRVIDRDEHVNLHFVCFVNVNNELYELDGRHPHPIKHTVEIQPGQSLDLLRSSKDVILKLIENAGGDIRFSMMALTKST
jgi:ubiquitin carboxyl-terminal hydrolase L3